MSSNWFLKVKTLDDEHLVDLGSDGSAAGAILEQAKKQMGQTGAVTIADSLVLNASDIVSISLHQGAAAGDLAAAADAP
jgi:hypothetical protein